MNNIGGNINATIQIKTTVKNAIGESVESWLDVGSCLGFLDFLSGQNEISQYNAKIQNTTHIWMCDVDAWKNATQGSTITSENSRLVVNGKPYTILMIDNPMELNEHLEVFLQYVGGGLGV